MTNQSSEEPVELTGSNQSNSKKPAKSSLLRTYKSFWLVGLPLFLMAVVIFNGLWSPVQTRQYKEFLPLSGTAPATISYRLTLEYSNPQKLSLKLSAANPVGLKIIQSGQTKFSTTLTPPSEELSLVEIPLNLTLDNANRTVNLELNFGNGNWKLAYHNKNVYRAGEFEPGGASPTNGDLFFTVDYGSQPLLRLERFFDGQKRWGGPTWLAIGALFFTLALFIFGLVKIARDPEKLANRILYHKSSYFWFAGFCLLLAAGWSLSFMLLNPPLQGPDEQGHVTRAIALGRGVDPESLAPEVRKLMDDARLVDNFAWLNYDEDIFSELPANNQAHQAPLYYFVASGMVKVGQLFTSSFAGQTYFVRLTSLLFLLGTVGAALACGWILRLSAGWLALGLPLAAALWPQLLFLGSVSNNDNAATCFAAWACFGMLRLFRAEKLRDWLLAGGLVLVALILADFSKRTVVTAWGGFALGVWVLILLKVSRRWKIIWLSLTALALVAFGITAFAFTSTSAARGWYAAPFVNGQHPDRLADSQASAGSYVLRLSPAKPIEQGIDMFYRPDVRRVFLSARLRAEKAPAQVKVELWGIRKILAEITVDATTTDWQPIGFEAEIPPEVANSRTEAFLRLRFSVPDGSNPFLLDEVFLRVNERNGENLTVNPSVEEGNLTLVEPYRSNSACLVCFFANTFLDILSNGRGLALGEAIFQNLTFFFLTIWGAYGWGQIFLSFIWYGLAALVTVFALAGLLVLPRRYKLASWQKAFGWYCGLALLSTLVIQILVKFWSWIYTGAQDFVAGRFMLIVILPLLFLLLSGLRGLSRKDAPVWPGLWVFTTFLFILNLAALLAHLLIQYY